MILLGNIIWLVLFGLCSALGWVLAAVLMAITIIGLPWARACLTIASYSLWPFGRQAIRRDILTGKQDIGTGDLGLIGNIIWFILAGVWLAIGHFIIGVALCLTIIGIPFAFPHFRLASLAIAPIGKTIVPTQIANEALMHDQTRENG